MFFTHGIILKNWEFCKSQKMLREIRKRSYKAFLTHFRVSWLLFCENLTFCSSSIKLNGKPRYIKGFLGVTHRLHSIALITIFTLHDSSHNTRSRKGDELIMIFSERLKKEREKRNWSQNDLAEKIHVSRQSVSKWETGKNYPSIEVLINLSDLFQITVDELLRSDEELKEKIIRESKQLAFPNWKMFFDIVLLIGAFLLVSKLIIFGLNKFAGTDITILKSMPVVSNFLPLALMVIGGIGSDYLKDKYLD